jgi:hypothetical protein
MVLRYHSKTFQLLGIEPRRSAFAVEALARVKNKIGRTLPASVREWYELENACSLLLEHSNDDQPVDIAEFGGPQRDTHGGRPHDLLANNLLVFRCENQGVCAWAIQLDGSADPPVVVDFDTQFKSWIRCAPSFSQHIYAWMWDYGVSLARLRSDDLLIQAQNRPLSMEALSFLNNQFEAELVTHGWPGHTQYRFFMGDQRILIWADRNQADWHLAAEDEASLERLVSLVSPVDALAEALWSHTAEGEALLTRIRGSRASH